ncbi:MAG: CHC2 zinc finger domain-containing protein [Patescibacteria group bacterium]
MVLVIPVRSVLLKVAREGLTPIDVKDKLSHSLFNTTTRGSDANTASVRGYFLEEHMPRHRRNQQKKQMRRMRRFGATTLDCYYRYVQDNVSWEDLLQKLGLSYKRKGDGLWICCRFHQEKTASMRLSSEKGLFYCYGCGCGGTQIHFISRLLNSRHATIIWFWRKFKIPSPFIHPELYSFSSDKG